MDIQTVAVKNLNPASYNPRKDLTPSDPDYQKLKRSIEEWGLVEPIVWNKRTGNVVGGHQRLKVMVAEFGATEVSVSVVDLDDAKERALNVALNKISGEWDEGQLAILLSSLDDRSALLTGFDISEIAGLLQKIDLDDAMGGVINSVQFNASEAAKVESDFVTLQYSMLLAQKTAVLDAIKRARLKTGIKDNAEALVAICESYK